MTAESRSFSNSLRCRCQRSHMHIESEIYTDPSDSATCTLLRTGPFSDQSYMTELTGTYSYRSDVSISIAFLTNTRSFPTLTVRPERFSPNMFVIKMIPAKNSIP